MNPNIRELVDYSITLGRYMLRHDVLIGDRQFHRDFSLEDEGGLPLMDQIEERRRISEKELLSLISAHGLSISNARPLRIPKGMSFPPWYRRPQQPTTAPSAGAGE